MPHNASRLQPEGRSRFQLLTFRNPSADIGIAFSCFGGPRNGAKPETRPLMTSCSGKRMGCSARTLSTNAAWFGASPEAAASRFGHAPLSDSLIYLHHISRRSPARNETTSRSLMGNSGLMLFYTYREGAFKPSTPWLTRRGPVPKLYQDQPCPWVAKASTSLPLNFKIRC